MPTPELIRRAAVSGTDAAAATTLFEVAELRIHEAAWRPKCLLRFIGQPAPTADIALGDIVLAATPNRIAAADPLCLWLSPRDWLVVGRKAPAASAVPADLTAADASDGLTEIRVAGALARTLLACGSSMDFHVVAFAPGQSARTRFARTAAVIACVREHEFVLLFERSVAVYAAEWLERSARMVAALGRQRSTI